MPGECIFEQKRSRQAAVDHSATFAATVTCCRDCTGPVHCHVIGSPAGKTDRWPGSILRVRRAPSHTCSARFTGAVCRTKR